MPETCHSFVLYEFHTYSQRNDVNRCQNTSELDFISFRTFSPLLSFVISRNAVCNLNSFNGSVFSFFVLSSSLSPLFGRIFVYYIDANLLTVPYERCVSCAMEDGRINGLLFHALAKVVQPNLVEKGQCVAIERL